MSRGPLFEKEERVKRLLSQARAKNYGAPPDDRDTFLSQIAKCAALLGVDNPYPEPGKPVEVKEITP